MSRYIDADKLRALFDNNSKVSGAFYCAEWEGIDKPSDFQDLIDAQPTADVRENVRGEWIDKPNREFCFRADFKTIECNQCGYNMPKSDSFAGNFCPNCGADMRHHS